MRTAQYRNSAAGTKTITERIGQLSCVGVGADKHDIDVLRYGFGQILRTGIADKRDLMSFLFAPGSDSLGHNIG